LHTMTDNQRTNFPSTKCRPAADSIELDLTGADWGKGVAGDFSAVTRASLSTRDRIITEQLVNASSFLSCAR